MASDTHVTSCVKMETANRKSGGGQSLHTIKWVPDGQPIALLFIAHGVGEHMGRYNELGEFLIKHGILVFGHDQVGHGKSEGDRVHINDFRIYYNDVIQHVQDTTTEYPGVPCILMGHSNGGLIAAHVAILKPELFAGLILSSPNVEVDPKVGWFTKSLVQVVGGLLPQFGVKTIDTAVISSISEEVQRYNDDPLIYHGALKAKWVAEALSAIKEIQCRMSEIVLPLLTFHGCQDELVPFSASEFAFATVSSTNKTFERFESSRHEVLHDKDQQRARNMIKEWILSLPTLPVKFFVKVGDQQTQDH